MVREYTYLIWKKDSTYYCQSGLTGCNEYSNSSAAAVIQHAADALTAGGTILFKYGTYVITTGVTFAQNTHVDGQGSTFDMTGLAGTCFTFGTNTIAGWAGNNAAHLMPTGISNAVFSGDQATYPAQLCVRINQINEGAIVEHVTLHNCANGVEIWGACYGAFISNVKGQYMNGTFIKLVGEDLGDTEVYAPNDTHITHCEMTAVSTTAIGIDITTDGGAASVAADQVMIDNCYLEGLLYGVRNYGTGTSVDDCYIALRATATNPVGILAMSAGSFISVKGCNLAVDCQTGTAIKMGAYQYVIADNFFQYISGNAIVLDDTTGWGAIVGNTCFIVEQAYSSAFVSGVVMGAVIVGNNVKCEGSTHKGVVLSSGSAYDVIASNRFFGLAAAVDGPGAHIDITGNQFRTCTVSVDLSELTDLVFVGNHLSNAPSSGFYTDVGEVASNVGLVTKASGAATFAAATSLVVTHGMAATPTKVQVTGTDTNSGALWVTSIGASTFTVNRGNSTGTPVIYWSAEV